MSPRLSHMQLDTLPSELFWWASFLFSLSCWLPISILCWFRYCQPFYTCAHQSRNLPSWAALLGEAGTCRTLLKWPSELEAGFENLNLGTCKAGEVQVVWILCLVSTALSRLLSIRDDFGYLFVVFMMLCIFRSEGRWGRPTVAGTPRNSSWETSSRFIVWWVFSLLDFFTKYYCLFGFFFTLFWFHI